MEFVIGNILFAMLHELGHAAVDEMGFPILGKEEDAAGSFAVGQKNLKSDYKLFAWLYPVGRVIYPAGFCTLQEVGQAMIKAATKGYPKQILEVKDIVALAAS